MFLYTAFFFKVWGEDFKLWAEEHFQATLPPEAFVEYQKQMEAMRPLMDNLAFQGGLMFATVLIIGLVVTLVVAFVLQTKEKSSRLAWENLWLKAHDDLRAGAYVVVSAGRVVYIKE